MKNNVVANRLGSILQSKWSITCGHIAFDILNKSESEWFTGDSPN